MLGHQIRYAHATDAFPGAATADTKTYFFCCAAVDSLRTIFTLQEQWSPIRLRLPDARYANHTGDSLEE